MNYNFNIQTDRKIRESLQMLNNDFYYGCATIDINTQIYMTCHTDYCQTYMAKIRFQLQNDVISFIVKSDDSGDLDYIKIIDGYSIDVMINKIRESSNFWGISIKNIETGVDHDFNETYKYYKIYVL